MIRLNVSRGFTYLSRVQQLPARALARTQPWRSRIQQVLTREEGATLAEYAVALTVAVVAIAGVVALAQGVLARFNAVNGAISGLP